MMRRRGNGSPTWMTFLRNHMTDMVAADFFVVPTVSFDVLFVFLILAHDRRRVLHFNATGNPSAQWAAQQPTAGACHEGGFAKWLRSSVSRPPA